MLVRLTTETTILTVSWLLNYSELIPVAAYGHCQVGQLVAAMKMGRIKLRTEKPKDEEPKFYDLWANSEQVDWCTCDI